MTINMDYNSKNRSRSISIFSTGSRIVAAVAIVLLAQLALLNDQNVLVNCKQSSSIAPPNANVSNPLIYKRLRFDTNYMQVYRLYQKHLAIDEHKESFKVNETLWNGAKGKFETKEMLLEYYQNDQVEATNFTYDDLIFDALDRTYLSRLEPAYVHNYDNKQDLLKSSDPSKVSRSRCDKELNFLLDQLYEIEKARVVVSGEGVRTSNAISPELIGFFDVFANEEPGLLLGNYHWTGGSWSECSKRLVFNVDKSNLSNSVEFKGRYCMASIRSRNWDSKVAERAKELNKIDYFRYADQEANYKRFHRIQLGMCLPESCDSQIISTRRDDIKKLATFKLNQPFRSYDLADLYCLPDETSELRQLEPSGKLFMCFAFVWLSLVTLATYLDHKHSSSAKSKSPPAGGAPIVTPGQVPRAATTTQQRPQLTVAQKLVSSFSLIRNYERLIETKSCQPPPPLSSRFDNFKLAGAAAADSTPMADARGKSSVETPAMGTAENGSHKCTPNDLLFLNGIKVLCMTMVVFGHTNMQMKHLDRFPLDFDCQNKLITHSHFSAVFYVDWFFVITGFLMSYIMFVANKVERNSIVDWFYALIHRYWRLAPLYVVLFWFAQSVFMHTGSGPLWDYGSSNMTFRSICRNESLWFPLTLTANFHPIHQSCIMPAWYVSSDMQFFLTVPFLLVLLHKSALLGWLITCGTIVASVALRVHRYLTDEHARPLDLMRPQSDLYMRNNWDMHETYLLPWYRICSFLIGLLAGHYTYMVLSGKWKSSLYFNPATWFAPGTPESARSAQFKPALKSAATRRSFVWLIGLTLLSSMMYSTLLIYELFPVKLEPHVKYFTAVIYGFSHAIAGLAVALCLVALMLGQWEPFKQLLSHPWWTVLSRINYLLLLVQVEVINWVFQYGDRLVEMSVFEMLKNFSYVSLILYPLCFLIAIILEQPLIQLEQNFIAPIFRSWGSSGARKLASGDAGTERSRRTGHDMGASKSQRGQASELMPINAGNGESTKLFSAK